MSFEVDYDTDEDENTLLSSDIKTELSIKDRLINLVSSGTAFPNAKSGSDRVIDMCKIYYTLMFMQEKQRKIVEIFARI